MPCASGRPSASALVRPVAGRVSRTPRLPGLAVLFPAPWPARAWQPASADLVPTVAADLELSLRHFNDHGLPSGRESALELWRFRSAASSVSCRQPSLHLPGENRPDVRATGARYTIPAPSRVTVVSLVVRLVHSIGSLVLVSSCVPAQSRTRGAYGAVRARLVSGCLAVFGRGGEVSLSNVPAAARAARLGQRTPPAAASWWVPDVPLCALRARGAPRAACRSPRPTCAWRRAVSGPDARRASGSTPARS